MHERHHSTASDVPDFILLWGIQFSYELPVGFQVDLALIVSGEEQGIQNNQPSSRRANFV